MMLLQRRVCAEPHQSSRFLPAVGKTATISISGAGAGRGNGRRGGGPDSDSGIASGGIREWMGVGKVIQGRGTRRRCSAGLCFCKGGLADSAGARAATGEVTRESERKACMLGKQESVRCGSVRREAEEPAGSHRAVLLAAQIGRAHV